MLFGNTFVAVSLNGSPWEDFRIERGGGPSRVPTCASPLFNCQGSSHVFL